MPTLDGTDPEALASSILAVLGSVGKVEAKKIESNLRFEWAKSKKCYPDTDIRMLRGVNYRIAGGRSKKNKTGRDSVLYIGKGQSLEKRHPLYDRYEQLYESEVFKGKRVGRKPIQ